MPPSQVSTSSWITYKNSDYGFEAKYPLDYTVNTSSDRMEIYKKSGQVFLDYFMLNIITNEIATSLDTYLKIIDRRGETGVLDYKIEQFIMNGEETAKTSYRTSVHPEEVITRYILYKNSRIFTALIDSDVHEQIFKSIRFR